MIWRACAAAATPRLGAAPPRQPCGTAVGLGGSRPGLLFAVYSHGRGSPCPFSKRVRRLFTSGARCRRRVGEDAPPCQAGAPWPAAGRPVKANQVWLFCLQWPRRVLKPLLHNWTFNVPRPVPSTCTFPTRRGPGRRPLAWYLPRLSCLFSPTKWPAALRAAVGSGGGVGAARCSASAGPRCLGGGGSDGDGVGDSYGDIGCGGAAAAAVGVPVGGTELLRATLALCVADRRSCIECTRCREAGGGGRAR